MKGDRERGIFVVEKSKVAKETQYSLLWELLPSMPGTQSFKALLGEVSLNEKCHRTKSFLSETIPYRCNYVSQVLKKNSLSLTLG